MSIFRGSNDCVRRSGNGDRVVFIAYKVLQWLDLGLGRSHSKSYLHLPAVDPVSRLTEEGETRATGALKLVQLPKKTLPG